jgi:hypothetical protein
LHLPDALQGSTACCPLCSTTFPTRAEPPLPLIPAGPTAPPPVRDRRLPYREVPFPAAPAETEHTTRGEDLPLEDRETMRNAASWLRWFVVTASVQICTCGCVNVLSIVDFVEASHLCLALPFLVQAIALIVVYRGAEAIGGRRKRGLGQASCILTLLLCGVQVLLPLMALANRPRPEAPFSCVSLGMAGVVVLIGMIGAMRGLLILNKPEVIRYFQHRQ